MSAERRKRILVVDDEPANRELLEAVLTGLGYEVEQAADGVEALAMINPGIDLVLLDLMMPGMDGFEVARQIRAGSAAADVPICMVTALSGRAERLRAVEAGASDFVAKPVERTELRIRVAALLRTKGVQDALKRHQADLEETVARRTASLRQALEETASAQRRTEQAQLETIERLALAAEYRDEGTGSHIRRMSRYCHLLAGRRGLPPRECETLLHASPMHDVGKIGIPDAILLKPGKLDAAEWVTMATHAAIGARILAGSTSELLQAGETVARAHHEKWDGSGYPAGLAGAAIPLWGRIAAVADVFDALTSKRPYRDAFPNGRAIAILEAGRGAHFDPDLVGLFLAAFDEVCDIQQRDAGGATDPPNAPPDKC